MNCTAYFFCYRYFGGKFLSSVATAGFGGWQNVRAIMQPGCVLKKVFVCLVGGYNGAIIKTSIDIDEKYQL